MTHWQHLRKNNTYVELKMFNCFRAQEDIPAWMWPEILSFSFPFPAQTPDPGADFAGADFA